MPETGNKITAKASIDLIDETFDISQSESYRLSVQTGPEGLSFCIFNTIINKYIVLRHYPVSGAGNDVITADFCERIFADDDLLGLKYKNCEYLQISPRCTLVPEHLFDPTHASAYLNFNHGWKAGEHVLHNYVRSAKAYNIFSCPEELMNMIRRYQPGIVFYHHAAPFIDTVVAESTVLGKPRVAVCYYSDYMDITMVKDKKLLLYNTFCVNVPEDSVYYLAGVLNMFDMALASVKLFYAGNIKEAPTYLEFVQKYVDRIVECEPTNTVTYSHYITAALRARFIHLFNLYGCVS